MPAVANDSPDTPLDPVYLPEFAAMTSVRVAVRVRFDRLCYVGDLRS